MRNRSIRASLGLIFLFLLGTTAYPQGQPWPLHQKIDLSSGFGDIRGGRYHAGVDIRTGSRIGRWVYSPVNGYVSRIKMSYVGSGKALYITGDDGFTYVFYHLKRFADPIEQFVKSAQFDAERYYLDLYLDIDSLRVNQGDRIALSGQTGAGAPHLHFEKRDKNNLPLNPLTHGFTLEDRTPPVFERLGVIWKDDHSLFANGRRKAFIELAAPTLAGEYRLASPLYLNGSFGLLLDGYDQMRPGGMRQSIRSLSLTIDDELYFESVIDSLDWESMRSVALVFDLGEALSGNKRTRRLYAMAGSDFAGNQGLGSHDGIFGRNEVAEISHHRALIRGEDSFGNTSELSFDFVWGPPGDLFELDSMVEIDVRTHDYFFSPPAEIENLPIDSFQVQIFKDSIWLKTPSAEVFRPDHGGVRVRADGNFVRMVLLRLVTFATGGAVIADEPFSGMLTAAARRPSMDYDVVEDGLIVTAKAAEKYGSASRVELYLGDSLLGTESQTRFVGKGRHAIFVPEREIYSRVDRLGFVFSDKLEKEPRAWQDVTIVMVGIAEVDTLRADAAFTVTIPRASLYEPRYVGVRHSSGLSRVLWRMNSDGYAILPKTFATRQDFDIDLPIATINQSNGLSGLCWLDEQEERWVWIDHDTLNADHTAGQSMGGGVFAAVFDYDAPTISDLNLVAGRTLETLTPEITFLLEDSLSGIADDRSIDVRIDKKFCLVEFDPESKKCSAQLEQPLEPGEHHLAMIITDRAGNVAEQYLKFNVTKPRDKKTGK